MQQDYEKIKINNLSVLDIFSENISLEKIKKEYKIKARKWHPDKNPTIREYAEKKMKEINFAYESLMEIYSREENVVLKKTNTNTNTNNNNTNNNNNNNNTPVFKSNSIPPQTPINKTTSIYLETCINKWNQQKKKATHFGIQSQDEINFLLTLQMCILFLKQKELPLPPSFSHMFDFIYLKKLAMVWCSYQELQQGKTRFLNNLMDKYYFIQHIQQYSFASMEEIMVYAETRKTELCQMNNVPRKKMEWIKKEYVMVDFIIETSSH